MLTRKGEESPVLCQHWGGNEFHEEVRKWAAEQFLIKETPGDGITDRWYEVGRIFVRLVQRFGDGGYVGKTQNEVDDSDYGCLRIELGDNGPEFSM